MKKFVFALALAAVLSPLAANADLVVYKTFQEAWNNCIDGRVTANYIYANGQFVQNGWVCIPGSGGQ